MTACQKTCPDCHASFECGPTVTRTHCWCAELPHVMDLEAATHCLCPVCLKRAIGQRLSERASATERSAPVSVG